MIKLLFILVLSAKAAPIREYSAQVIEIAPYGYYENGQATGIYVDFFKQFATETSERINIQIVPFTRAIHDLRSGSTDLLLTVIRKDVDEKAQRVCQPFSLPSIVFSPREVFKSWTAIEGKKVIRIRGGCHDVEQKMQGKIQFVEVKNINQGLVMLYAKRGDAVCADIHSIQLNLKKLGKEPEAANQAFRSSIREVVLYANPKVPKDMIQKLKNVCDKADFQKQLNKYFQ